MVSQIAAPLLEVDGLVVSDSPDRGPAPVSLVLKPSSVVWITGPSGVGKTTILKSLARLVAHHRGEIRFQGLTRDELPSAQWRMRVHYLHQKAVMFPGTVRTNLSRAFTLSLRHSQEPDMRGAMDWLNRLLLPKSILDRDARVLSVGEAARIALVRALMVDPDILLLDEPTASLDPESTEASAHLLAEWVATDERGIVGVSHDPVLRTRLPGEEVILVRSPETRGDAQ